MRNGRSKTARDENFPVASLVISRRLRPAVMDFYAFARAADDVADDPALASAAKLARLDAFEAGLDGKASPPEAARLRARLLDAGLGDRHARDLLVAFRRDALKPDCASWAELAEYCAYSAHPVGRFMLELHGEPRGLWPQSDALCAALQILNHLQDCADDLRRLDRIYLPRDWMAVEGIDRTALLAERSSPGLRRVIDRVLEATAPLVARSAGLSEAIASRRLGAQVAVTHRLCRRLQARLATGDPVAGRVALTSADFALAALGGLAAAGFGRHWPAARAQRAVH